MNKDTIKQALEAVERAKKLPVWDNIPHALHVELDMIFKSVAALSAEQQEEVQPQTNYSFTCPECGSYRWGTSNLAAPKDEWVGNCHGWGCQFSWMRKDDDKVFTAAPSAAPVQPASKPEAYMTLSPEGDPAMLFFDRTEAAQYCDDDEDPIPLTRCATSEEASDPCDGCDGNCFECPRDRKEASFDKARMEEALAQPQIDVPDGLSREELRSFIVAHGKEASAYEALQKLAKVEAEKTRRIAELEAQLAGKEASEAIRTLRNAISKQLDPSWECNSDHPALHAALKSTEHFANSKEASDQVNDAVEMVAVWEPKFEAVVHEQEGGIAIHGEWAYNVGFIAWQHLFKRNKDKENDYYQYLADRGISRP